MLPMVVSMEEIILGSKLFIGCSLWKMDAYQLLRVGQKFNTFFSEECQESRVYWLKTSGPLEYLIGMENSVLSLHDHRSHFLIWKVNVTGNRDLPTM